VDAITITGRGGHFALVCKAPVKGLDLLIEHAQWRRTARVRVGSQRGKRDRLTLEAGSTIEGRIVHQGQGLPGVSVGIVQSTAGTTGFSAYQHTTDAEGRFSF